MAVLGAEEVTDPEKMFGFGDGSRLKVAIEEKGQVYRMLYHIQDRSGYQPEEVSRSLHTRNPRKLAPYLLLPGNDNRNGRRIGHLARQMRHIGDKIFLLVPLRNFQFLGKNKAGIAMSRF